MTTGQKFLTGILLGAAAGAGIALFLQSEKGKEFVEAMKTKLGEMTDEAEESIASKWHDFNDEMSELMKRGRKFVEDLEHKAKESIS
ncbi:YtxH domain-containing protein [Foetidibacter luteolus]|uniref:YtxH domain-containing protein n=1 Tax=Foetidibacter luteolus TaxID=2608880 RepID=UPI001A9863C5|nr:YtxH domain-containing protein [Foetidibacter luteolus]